MKRKRYRKVVKYPKFNLKQYILEEIEKMENWECIIFTIPIFGWIILLYLFNWLLLEHIYEKLTLREVYWEEI